MSQDEKKKLKEALKTEKAKIKVDAKKIEAALERKIVAPQAKS